MTDTIKFMEDSELFRSIDIHFAGFIESRATDSGEFLILTAALLSRQLGRGHVCLRMEDFAGKPLLDEEGEETSLRFPDICDWKKSLEKNIGVVGKPGEFRPIILERDRIYLHRFWKYEQDLTTRILKMIRNSSGIPDVKNPILRRITASLFSSEKQDEPDYQKMAAVAALYRRFCIISGGPGTGKTTTLARILCMLLASDPDLKIALCAPTGKAAARINEALRKAVKNMEGNAPWEILQKIPVDHAGTIHRLLKARRGGMGFIHRRDNPLTHDVVVVDEASMVDITLMGRLVDALKKNARFILLGDSNQLASVDVGAFLGDICRGKKKEVFSARFAEFYNGLTGEKLPDKIIDDNIDPYSPGDSIIELKKSWRYDEKSGIGRLSSLVKSGGKKSERIFNLFRDFKNIEWIDCPSRGELRDVLRNLVWKGWEKFFNEIERRNSNPSEMLRHFNGFRILCALRKGPFGVHNLNLITEEILQEAGLISRKYEFYDYRPVMVTANDYNIGLYNGDIGLVLPTEETGENKKALGVHRAFFESAEEGSEENSLKKYPPAVLPPHETVYAMTIHKSQGSEYDELLIVLPDRDSPVLSRELIYTGITRSKKKVTIIGNRKVFLNGIQRRISRSSGIEKRLWEK